MSFFIQVPQEELPAEEPELTYQFILRPNSIAINPSELYGNNLWIAVTFGYSSSYLWCKLHVSLVEELLEGKLLISYLISGDIDKSAYVGRLGHFTQDQQIVNSPTIESIPPNVVTEIDFESVNQLLTIINNCSPIRIAPPDLNRVKRPPADVPSVSPVIQFRGLVHQLKREYTMAELFRYSRYVDLTPYEVLAFSYMRQKDKGVSRELLKVIQSDHEQFLTERAWQQVRTVDIGLRSINVNDIHVRRFVNPPETDIDKPSEDIASKLDRAEAVHQAILADLASHIYDLGQTPCETNSIDLCIEGRNCYVVIEIKSATEYNFYRQSVRGALQIQEYSYAMKAYRGTPPRTFLVIQHTANEAIKAYCHGFLSYIGIETMYYDEKLNWPDRVAGFDEMVASVD